MKCGGLGFYSLFDKHLLGVRRSNKELFYDEVKFDKKYPITLTPQTFSCLWVVVSFFAVSVRSMLFGFFDMQIKWPLGVSFLCGS